MSISEKLGVGSQKRRSDRRRHPHLSGRMPAEQRDRLVQLINNPPPGSKLAAAKEHGIDLTLFLTTLELTPAERFERLQEAEAFLEELRRRADLTTPEKLKKESPQSRSKRKGSKRLGK